MTTGSLNSLLARDKLSSADILANSSNPDLARQNVGPGLDSNCFDTLIVFLEEFFEIFTCNLKKKKKHKEITQQAKLRLSPPFITFVVIYLCYWVSYMAREQSDRGHSVCFHNKI